MIINVDVHVFIHVGAGDMVDIGCVCVNPSRDTVLDPLTEDNCITDPVLNFDNTNNGVEMRGTVVVKNFR